LVRKTFGVLRTVATTEATPIVVSVPQRNERMRRRYADAREQGLGGRIKRFGQTAKDEIPSHRLSNGLCSTSESSILTSAGTPIVKRYCATKRRETKVPFS
jgi:hypothetical protein